MTSDAQYPRGVDEVCSSWSSVMSGADRQDFEVLDARLDDPYTIASRPRARLRLASPRAPVRRPRGPAPKGGGGLDPDPLTRHRHREPLDKCAGREQTAGIARLGALPEDGGDARKSRGSTERARLTPP